MLSPKEIQRHWRLFRTVLPASSADYSRRRTPYFYRKHAISFRRLARTAWTAEMRATFLSLAKSYYADYRRRTSPEIVKLSVSSVNTSAPSV